MPAREHVNPTTQTFIQYEVYIRGCPNGERVHEFADLEQAKKKAKELCGQYPPYYGLPEVLLRTIQRSCQTINRPDCL